MSAVRFPMTPAERLDLRRLAKEAGKSRWLELERYEEWKASADAARFIIAANPAAVSDLLDTIERYEKAEAEIQEMAVGGGARKQGFYEVAYLDALKFCLDDLRRARQA